MARIFRLAPFFWTASTISSRSFTERASLSSLVTMRGVTFADELESAHELGTGSDRGHLLGENLLGSYASEVSHLGFKPRLLVDGRGAGVSDKHLKSWA